MISSWGYHYDSLYVVLYTSTLKRWLTHCPFDTEPKHNDKSHADNYRVDVSLIYAMTLFFCHIAWHIGAIIKLYQTYYGPSCETDTTCEDNYQLHTEIQASIHTESHETLTLFTILGQFVIETLTSFSCYFNSGEDQGPFSVSCSE